MLGTAHLPSNARGDPTPSKAAGSQREGPEKGEVPSGRKQHHVHFSEVNRGRRGRRVS